MRHYKLIPITALLTFLLYTAAAQSATVNIYFPGGSQAVSFTAEDKILKQISFEPIHLNYRFTISVSPVNPETDIILSKLIYNCRDLSPADCVRQTSPTDDLLWSNMAPDLSRQEQRANVLTLVQFANYRYGISWIGFWDVITYDRLQSSFSFSRKNIDQIDFYAKTGLSSQAEEFIRSKYMLPISWAERIVLRSSQGFYELKTSDFVNYETFNRSGREISSADTPYALIFPRLPETANPITLKQIPTDFLPGDGICEDPDETPLNSCYDCPCSRLGQNLYCDLLRGCQREDSINFIVENRELEITSCFVPNNINLTIAFSSLPSDAQITEARYILANAATGTACLQQGNRFTCPITVPPVQNCNTSSVIKPNSMQITLEYSNGREGKVTKTITKPLPDITVATWECGDELCDKELGEDRENCCYDCGCAGGYYCDVGARPENSQCKQDFKESDLEIERTDPETPNYTDMGEQIIYFNFINRPSGLLFRNATCQVECMQGTQICEASCNINCRLDQQLVCGLNFRIQGYNQTLGYNLRTDIIFNFRYPSGYTYVTKTFSKSLDTGLGSQTCGNNICDPIETRESCCYDCGCSSGKFCNTQDIRRYTSGDRCEDKTTINIAVGQEPIRLNDTSTSHIFPLPISLTFVPGGWEIFALCRLSFSNIPCGGECDMKQCNITIPSIDHENSEYFNREKKLVEFFNNIINFTLNFNNGPRKETKEIVSPMGNLSISPPFCGNDLPEGAEDASNCCVDVRCETDPAFGPEYFCSRPPIDQCGCHTDTTTKSYCQVDLQQVRAGLPPVYDLLCPQDYIEKKTEEASRGVCVTTSAIRLIVNGTNPAPYECTVYNNKGECRFLQAAYIFLTIINIPPKFKIIESFYLTSNRSFRTYCLNRTVSDYVCAVLLPPLQTTNISEIPDKQQVNFFLTAKYTINNSVRITNLTTSHGLDIGGRHTDRVNGCIEQGDFLRNKIHDYRERLHSYDNIWRRLWIFAWMHSVYRCICNVFSGGSSCKKSYGMESCRAAFELAPSLISLAILLSDYSYHQVSLTKKIKEYKDQLGNLCSSRTVEELRLNIANSSQILQEIDEVAPDYKNLSRRDFPVTAGGTHTTGVGGNTESGQQTSVEQTTPEQILNDLIEESGNPNIGSGL